MRSPRAGASVPRARSPFQRATRRHGRHDTGRPDRERALPGDRGIESRVKKWLGETARKSDEFVVVRLSRGGRAWRLADMTKKRTGRVLGIEAALRELVRDVVRDELRYLREDMLDAIRGHNGPPPKEEPNPEELLTVEQVAQLLKVIPDTVRTWIQSGALRASRPGDGTRPGRKYRVRRGDLDAFIAASERAPARPEVVAMAESEGTSAGLSHRAS